MPPQSPFVEFMRSARKNSDNFEENLLKLVRTLPTVLKFLPSQKAQDARNFVQARPPRRFAFFNQPGFASCATAGCAPDRRWGQAGASLGGCSVVSPPCLLCKMLPSVQQLGTEAAVPCTGISGEMHEQARSLHWILQVQ